MRTKKITKNKLSRNKIPFGKPII